MRTQPLTAWGAIPEALPKVSPFFVYMNGRIVDVEADYSGDAGRLVLSDGSTFTWFDERDTRSPCARAPGRRALARSVR